MLLNWRTGLEVNFRQFDLERSVGGGAYIHVASIASKGDHSTYTYNDAVTDKNVSYRLRMLDYDGTYKFSNVVFISNACMQRVVGQMELYPNPVSSEQDITVEYTCDTKYSEAQITIQSAEGKILETLPFPIVEGTNVKTISTDKMSKGMYIIQLNQNGKILQTRKFVVQ